MPILEVENLSVSFQQYTSGLKQKRIHVIPSLSLALNEGEVLAVVGASGSGKSLLAHAILGILPSNASVAGRVKYKGEELTPSKQMALRGKEIALVPQSVNFLDPLIKTGKQVRSGIISKDRTSVQREAFRGYHLGKEVENMYPFQLSGGMARRALLSTATVSGAKVIIADEPTPGLDVGVMNDALSHFRELADGGSAIMLITHDIESALTIADKIAVMYAGTNVEIAPVEDFSGKGEALRHPYSQALWLALPQNDFIPIPGTQPDSSSLPPGCLFAPRCSMATSPCSESHPEMRELRNGMVSCIHAT